MSRYKKWVRPRITNSKISRSKDCCALRPIEIVIFRGCREMFWRDCSVDAWWRKQCVCWIGEVLARWNLSYLPSILACVWSLCTVSCLSNSFWVARSLPMRSLQRITHTSTGKRDRDRESVTSGETYIVISDRECTAVKGKNPDGDWLSRGVSDIKTSIYNHGDAYLSCKRLNLAEDAHFTESWQLDFSFREWSRIYIISHIPNLE